MDKLVKWLTQPFVEDINIPVKVGDTILTGRFKNKKTVVKSIDKDEHGMPTINGRKVTTFRILKKQEENINEGVNDPGIFKAVFLAGGPGSGKTYVAKQLFGIPERYNISMTGMKMVNSDKELKFLLNKYGFGTDLDKMPDELFKDLTSKGQSGLRDYAKSLTKQRMKLYQDGKLGMIIDGTGHDYGKIAKMKRELQEDGYDTYMVFVNTSLDVAQQRNQERDRILPPKLLEKSWKDVQANLGKFQNLFKSNFLIVDNSKFLKPDVAQKKFASLVKQGITKFTKQPIKNKIAKSWIKKQQILKQQGLSEAFAVKGNKIEKFITGKNITYKGKKYKEIEYELVKVDNPQKAVLLRILAPKKLFGQKVAVRFQTLRRGPFFKTDTGKTEAARIPRKKGQHRNSPSHSDLYTDENPKGTIKGLKFATVKDAQKSVSKIKNSGKSHAHKIQAAVAMEQRAKEMGKKSQAAVYRTFINKMKKKTKKMNEKWSDKYKKSIDCNNPKGFSQKAHCDGKKKKSESLVGADGTIPSPSRKMVKKMKKKGHTSVPYGSGYKKVNEDRTKIKKVVGIYGGRFQPFGPHHKKTYDWLKSRVDDAYITTSNIKQPPRHPMDFREKVRHMVKMGIPKNRIIQEKSPYVANNVLKKYDEKTTAVIYIFGSKDAGRLKGGKYFKDYNKNRGNILGYKEHGYVLTAPHVSIKVGGKEVSGTVMRQLLGSPDYEKDREKLFKQAFGYFDKGIYNMMTNKFKKLFESIDEFLSKNNIKDIIKESTTALSPTDDGPPTFYRGFDDYKKFSKDWIDGMYYEMGWELINYILGKHAVNPDYDYTLSYNTVPAVAYGRKQSGSYGSRFGTTNPIKSYKDYIEDTVLRNLGYKVIKWMGITPNGNKYTGVEVETPVLPGIGKDNTANTELDKKEDLEERLRLDDEVKLIIEGGAYGHMNHPFDDKNLTFSDLKQIIINGLGGNLNREDNVTEKLDGQNLMVSWVNGKLVTARNKGQLKNFGATAMDTAGVASKFAGRGDIRNAFVFAMKDLSKSVGSLSDKQKEKVFGNGKRWMNLEVIYPKSVNVIDYDKTEIVFHGTLEYDDSGKATGQPKDSARMLAGMIKQVNQNVQKTYNIGKPQFLQVPKVQDFGKKKNTYLNRLKKLQNQYKLKDNDTLALYHQRFWEEFIFNASKQYKYKIPTKVLVNLTKRWAFFDKSYKIPMIKKDIDNKKFLNWVLSFDKNDHQKWVKQNMKPFEVLFFDVGAEILKNIGGYLSASPDEAVQKIRKDVINAIKTVKSGGDVKKIETLKHQLSKLEKIGGLSSIVPSEGIVFKYKGNTYKFTGAFAPVNQIVGLLNF